MRSPAMLVLVAVLAACSPARPDKATLTDVAAERAVRAGFNPGSPAAMATDTVDAAKTPAPGALLPPDGLKYRYIGRWAATRQACASAPWVFESRKLASPAKTTCAFTDTSTTLIGYELIGSCTTGSKVTPDIVTLRFNETARAMRVAGKSLPPADLIYCGG